MKASHLKFPMERRRHDQQFTIVKEYRFAIGDRRIDMSGECNLRIWMFFHQRLDDVTPIQELAGAKDGTDKRCEDDVGNVIVMLQTHILTEETIETDISLIIQTMQLHDTIRCMN